MYRSKPKKWRDNVSIELLGRKCTSSVKFQDDVFNDSAIPPLVLEVLGQENNRNNGAVEAYIYTRFRNKHSQLSEALNHCISSTKENVNLKTFIDSFREEVG